MQVGDIVKTRPGFWPVVVCIISDKQKGILGEDVARFYCFQHKRYFWEGSPKRRFEVISKKLA